MSKLSTLDERIAGLRDELYYHNKCCGQNQIERKTTPYGYISIHQVEDKKVVLTYYQYANGEDDYDDELVNVKIL